MNTRHFLLMGLVLVLTACGDGITKSKKRARSNNVNNVNNTTNNANNTTNNANNTNNLVQGPCVRLISPELDFGVVDVGQSMELAAEVANCSSDTSLNVLRSFGDGLESAEVLGVDAGLTAMISVTLQPEAIGTIRRDLTVLTTAGDIVLAVRAMVIDGDNPCPTALISAAVGGASLEVTNQLATGSNSVVSLSGAASTARQGAIRTYSWSVVDKPSGSSASFGADANLEDPELFVDSIGAYTVELDVVDALGTSSCAPARLSVQVTSAGTPRFRVLVTWETPSDTVPGDTFGTDVDLHYVHQRLGTWNSAPYDVYWRNPEPDWTGSTTSPKLVLDDVDGQGPEIVEHDAPMTAETYLIGAYYYADSEFDASEVTIRIEVDGVLAYESAGLMLAQKGDGYFGVALDAMTGQVDASGLQLVTGWPND